jgi:AcrR family transcriptional regulator
MLTRRRAALAKRVDKEQRRREIVDAAMELFAHHGFEATSISQIATAAGIGKATVFEYFDSKEALIEFAAGRWLQGWFDQLEAMVADVEDPVERLQAFALGSMEAFLGDEQTLKLMLSMWQLGAQGGLDLLQSPGLWQMWDSARRSISTAILDGVASGAFRPDVAPKAELIALNLMVYLDGIGLYHLMLGDVIDVLQHVRLHVDLLLASLRP